MKTDILSFVLSSKNRKKIVRTLFEYPKRQWSCSTLEELTKISHATVFRTLNTLKYFNILKSTRINKKDIIYELVSSPLSKELKRIIDIDKRTTKKIANSFIKKIKSNNVYSIILYGSSVKNDLKPESDIDVLVIVNKHNKILENEIFDIAAKISSKINRTISAVIMDTKELNKERDGAFINSIKNNNGVLYGKDPF